MNPLEWIVTYGCKLGLRMLYRIEDSEMGKIRANGPLILYPNHTSLLEAPMVYTFLKPRKKVTGLSKVENWKNPFLNLVFSLWKIIPVRRGESDMEALRATLGALADGYIIGIAPEGTRSPSGSLQRAQAGVTMLALHSGSPLQPLAQWKDRPLPDDVGIPTERRHRRFGRPVIHIRVGRAFHLDPKGMKLTREIRQEMTDEIMYQLAKLLPEDRRGEYADLSRATEKWLVFED
jgi:1-acyl-sn-glycerol-3-phosphate acyltransferase